MLIHGPEIPLNDYNDGLRLYYFDQYEQIFYNLCKIALSFDPRTAFSHGMLTV